MNDIAFYQSMGYTDASILNIFGPSSAIGALSGNGRVMLNAGQSQGSSTLTLGNGESSSFYGIIQDCTSYNVGNVVYAGTGTFTLWGEGTYRGSTTINSGTFTVNGKIVGSGVTVNGGTLTGSGNVNTGVAVKAGGTLAGTLSIVGNVTSTGGHSAPGGAGTAGTLTVTGSVSLNHASVLNFDLGAPGATGGGVNDLISITGDLSLDGTLNVNALSGFGPGVYTLIDYSGGLWGAGLTLGTTPSSYYMYTIDTGTANEINLEVAIPWTPPINPPGPRPGAPMIDAIYQHLSVAPSSYQGTWPRPLVAYQPAYDVNNDGVVSQADVTAYLYTYMLTSYGDSDMNKATDFQDFQILLNHWQASGSGVGWAEADFNGDGVVDFLDFQILLNYWNPGGWNYAPSQVPEPATLSLLALGAMGLVRRKRSC
jgi:hypothetical protein